MQTARFQWFIFISLTLHTLLLPLFHFVPFYERKPLPPLEVGLFRIPASPQQATSTQQDRTRRATLRTTPLQRPTRTTPPEPSVKTAIPPSAAEPSSREIEASVVPGRTSSGTGRIAPGSEETSTGSVGSPSEGTSSSAPTGTKGGSSGSGGAPAGTKRGSAGSERDAFSEVEIPAYVIDAAGFRSQFDAGAIYPEIDFYILYAVDKQTGINVPGTEVCIEGDQLRTKERMTITEIKTDYFGASGFPVKQDSEIAPRRVALRQAQDERIST